MNIQKTSSPNFQATRVLTAQKAFRNGKREVYEVFKLNYKEDLGFIKKCTDLLNTQSTKKLSVFQRGLKALFSKFLIKTNAMSEDFYIAIKDSEAFVGCMKSVPVLRDVIPSNLYSNNYREVKNKLFYAFLEDSQKNYEGFNIRIDDAKTLKQVRKLKIKSSDINTVKKKIKESASGFRFKSENEKNINLDDVFGVKDFETELNPNLK